MEQSNLRIVFAIDVPEMGIDYGCGGQGKLIEFYNFKITDLVENRNLDPTKCNVLRSTYDKRVRDYKDLVIRVLRDFPRVILFDPTPAFCNDKICNGFLEDYGYLYSDPDHLSTSGSLYFAEQLSLHLN